MYCLYPSPFNPSKHTDKNNFSLKHRTPCSALAHLSLCQDEYSFLTQESLVGLPKKSLPHAHTVPSLLLLIMLAAQGHNKGAGRGMGEQGHSKEPAHILIHHKACVQCYLYAAQIFPYPWCHHISLKPGAITLPQHSFFIFSPACFPSLLSQLFLPKVVTCQIRPTFSLILLRVGDLLLKQRCAEM